MTSKAQKLKGYPIPDEWITEETQSFCIVIPAGEGYRAAAYSQLLLLGKWWNWKRDLEDPESTRAKETAETWRLIFQMNEECGTMSIDYDAWAEAFGVQMYKVVNDVAKQIVSGRTTGFVVGEDGTVTDPSTGTGDVELPEDDPETVFDETLGAKNGGAKKVVDYLQEILTRMFTWYSTNPNPNDQQAAERLTLIYGMDSVKASAFANYWYTVYMNSQGTVTLNEASLDALMFCHGVSLKTFSEYIFEVHSVPLELPVLVEFVQALDDELLATWYQSGLEVPSTEYISYTCTKVQDESYSVDMSLANDPAYTTSETWKINHRFLIKVTGSFVDADVPNVIGDGMWEHNTLTGVKTFKPMTFNFSGGVVAPTQAQVPYNSSHAYEFTVEKTNASAAGIITMVNGSATVPNVTGTINVTIKDLGEFGL